MTTARLSACMPRALLAALLFVTAPGVFAHTAWLDSTGPGAYRVLFGGHGGPQDVEDYPAEKLGEVQAFDADGKALKVERGTSAPVQITAPRAAVLLLHFDNGFWSRAAEGSVNRPMNEVTGATSAVHAVKYGKTVHDWAAGTRVFDQPFEVVPLGDAAPAAGTPLRLQVRIDGKPAAGIAVMHDGEAPGMKSDADGVVELVMTPGINRIWAGQRTSVSDDARYTTLSIEYMLVLDLGARR